MALNIKDPETDRLVRELAALTGRPITQVVREAVEEKLETTRRRHWADQADRRRFLYELSARAGALPRLDDRSEDEILGYDENGLPS